MRKYFLALFFFLAVLTFLGMSFSGTNTDTKNKKRTTVTFKNIAVSAEVADTPVSRIRGLSGAVPLKEGEGMWFDFGVSGLPGIWMKEMNFPIDILWFDDAFRVVYIKENALPESYPMVFAPMVPARYVLEVSSGFVKKYRISAGDAASVDNVH